MTTTIIRIVSLALAVAFVCPMSMVSADEKVSRKGSSLKLVKPSIYKASPSKARAAITSKKKVTPSKSRSKYVPTPSKSRSKYVPTPSRTKPGSRYVPKPAPRQPIKGPFHVLPGKPTGKKNPFILPPKRKGSVKVGSKKVDARKVNGLGNRKINLDLIEHLSNRANGSANRGTPIFDPEALRVIEEATRNRRDRMEREDSRRFLDPDVIERLLNDAAEGGAEGENQAAPNCSDQCSDNCHHNHGPTFGFDFPRWGFAYGPDGVYIRGRSRYYADRPRDVVIVEQPAVVEEQVVAQPPADVQIREVGNLPKVHVGSTIALASKVALGDNAGQVILDVNGISLPAAVQAWTNESTTCTVPMMGLNQPKEARLIIVTGEGNVAQTIAVLLMPAKDPAEAP